MFSEQNTRTRWPSPEEEGKLLAVIPAPYAAFCKVALYTGAPRGELLAARWDQVDTKWGLLTLPTLKSSKPRFIELSSVVLGILVGFPVTWVSRASPGLPEGDSPLSGVGRYGRATQKGDPSYPPTHLRQPVGAGRRGPGDDSGARRVVGEGGSSLGAALRARRRGPEAGCSRGLGARGAAGAHWHRD